MGYGWFESAPIVIIYDRLFTWFVSVASEKFLDALAVGLRSLPSGSFFISSHIVLISFDFVQGVHGAHGGAVG